MSRFARRSQAGLASVLSLALIALSPGLEAPRLFAQIVRPVSTARAALGPSAASGVRAALVPAAAAMPVSAMSPISAAVPAVSAPTARAAASASVAAKSAAIAPRLESLSKPSSDAAGAAAAGREIDAVLRDEASVSAEAAAVAGPVARSAPRLSAPAAAAESSKPAPEPPSEGWTRGDIIGVGGVAIVGAVATYYILRAIGQVFMAGEIDLHLRLIQAMDPAMLGGFLGIGGILGKKAGKKAAPKVADDRIDQEAARVAQWHGEGKPYAEEFSRTYDRLKKEGATKAQLELFVKLANQGQTGTHGAGFPPPLPNDVAARKSAPKISNAEIARLAKSIASGKGGPHKSATEYNQEVAEAAWRLEEKGATPAQIKRFLKICEDAPEVNGGFSNYSGD